MSVLNSILENTRTLLPELRSRLPELEQIASERTPGPDIVASLQRPTVALIAEVKRRSPSAGAINETLDPVTLAKTYAESGAAAVSVLTEGPNFGGSIEDLAAVTSSVGVPILRKDFIVDSAQIVEARAHGASAVLLIVKALGEAELCELLQVARHWGMEALVEVHDAQELETAVSSGAVVIGVNSRNLTDFSIDLKLARYLVSTIPSDRIAVAESGISTPEGVRLAADAGADAVLVGGALSGSVEPQRLVKEICGVPRVGR